ncbi:uncharacterized protein LOC125189561 [Salvia hispanica]|uniref:uncharacterized protein LOC125189561 n=1 Tax=Salvia hispanica TaxID=49212 RepID=UPI0020096E23|nr:uncharacterized protein LOC125189561 [Salvia hispanica]
MENVNPDLEWSNFPEVSCVPLCSAELIPIVGKNFNTLDEGISFYDAYARATGFDTRKHGNKASRELVTWQYLVCNRQGVKKGIEIDQIHAREGFITKRRRTSKRCGCKARVSLKYVFEGSFVGYVVHEFVDVHNHSLIELPLRRWMHLNRKLDEVHRKFIWDCTKANISPTMTFKFLNEFLGGYDTVGITLTELRNYVHGLKSYVEGSDAQMLLDEMRRRKEACEGFSYQYQLGSENELKSLFWFVNVIPEKYYNGRWLKSALGKAVHGNLGKELDAPVNAKQLAKNKAYRIFYGLIQKYEGDIDKITSFSAGMLEYDRKKESDSPNMSVGENGNTVEDFYSIERPALVEVQPPNVVQTKGSCSDSASRLVSAKEKAVVLASKPKRRCGKCRELRHHDSRNFRKNMETTKALVISSTISIFQHFLHC